MIKPKFVWFFMGLPLAGLAREEIPITVPFHKFSQTLLASANFDEKSYLAFPVTLEVGPDEMLIAFKRGDAHARDPGAIYEIHAYQPSAGRLLERRAAVGEPAHPTEYYESAEFVRYPNGEISCFFDVQEKLGVSPSDPQQTGSHADAKAAAYSTGSTTVRLGLRVIRSRNGGKTFSPPRRVGRMDETEYGYVFDSVSRQGRTYMLAMRFANLPGGTGLHEAWPHAGSVDVLVSEDNGHSWRMLRNLTHEFGGIPINESALLPYQDGWLITCRGYDDRHWLVRTNAEFRLLARRNLTADFTCINKFVSRPRLYERDGAYYLVGRNWTQPGETYYDTPWRLCWFRFDPDSLAIKSCVVLDNAEGHHVIDGYYATAHWLERDGITFFNILTHKRADFAPTHRYPGYHDSDLIRMEFLWDEVK
ncbi:MAG: hypothetical protein ACREIA_21330 [Opitutaceae bacterium]